MVLVNTEDLVDAQWVADRLDLNHSNSVSLYQRRYSDMPKPVIDLGVGRPKLWMGAEMEAWARHRERNRTRMRPQWKIDESEAKRAAKAAEAATADAG